MKPLSPHVMVTMCLSPGSPECSSLEEQGRDSAQQPPAQLPCCREGLNQLPVDCMDGEPSHRAQHLPGELELCSRMSVGSLIYYREGSN